MLPRPHHFDDALVAGSLWLRTFLLRNPDDSPIDLTGCQAVLEFRRRPEDAVAAVRLTSAPAAGLTIVADEGRIDARIEGSVTAGLGGRYVRDLVVIWSGGDPWTVVTGTTWVRPAATQVAAPAPEEEES